MKRFHYLFIVLFFVLATFKSDKPVYFLFSKDGKAVKYEKMLLHYHGTYHSKNFESIYWYLNQQNPKLNIATITTVSQEDVIELKEENTGIADFTICVDKNMTKTR